MDAGRLSGIFSELGLCGQLCGALGRTLGAGNQILQLHVHVNMHYYALFMHSACVHVHAHAHVCINYPTLFSRA